jgi:hypothetical protein
MRILLRLVAIVFVLVAAVLVYAVIAAVASEGGAKEGVAIAYIVGAILLTWAATALWRRPARTAT